MSDPESVHRRSRWRAVYGAVVAHYATSRIEGGLGPADDAQMDDIVEEAMAVADHAEESFQRHAALRRDEKKGRAPT